MHNFSNYNAFLRQVWSPPNRYFNNPCHFHLYFYIMYWVSVGWKTSVFFFTSVFSSSNYFSSFLWWSFNCRMFFYVAGSTATSKTSQLKIRPTRDCPESKQWITRFLVKSLSMFPFLTPDFAQRPILHPIQSLSELKNQPRNLPFKACASGRKVGLFLGGKHFKEIFSCPWNRLFFPKWLCMAC